MQWSGVPSQPSPVRISVPSIHNKLKKMKQTLIMIAAIVLFLVAGSLAVQQCTKRADAEGERDLALAAYDSCVNAKVYTQVIVDTTDHIIQVVEKPVPYEVIRFDTIVIREVEYVYPVNRYSDTLKTDDFSLFWMAEGLINKIEFPYYRLYDKTVVESHVIEKPVYSYKDKSHLYFYFGLNTFFDKGLSGFSGGFSYINRKGWGLGAGYLRINHLNAFEAKVYVRIL